MLRANIYNGGAVNAFLFDAISAVTYGSNHTMESAFLALSKVLEGHALYRCVKYGNGISIGYANRSKRIASIHDITDPA